MKFRTNFEPNAGFRLHCNARSILLGFLASGSDIPDKMLLQSSASIEQFSNSARGLEPLPDGPSFTVHIRDIGCPRDDVIYKYVTNGTWKHIEAGSFQLGSCDYYRNIENKNSQDPREGECLVSLREGRDLVRVSVRAGFNCGIFCGTHTQNDAMRSKFGEKLIRISRLREFAEAVRCHLRGSRVFVRDVVYTNNKSVIIDHPTASTLRTDLRAMDGKLDIKTVNRKYFGLLYEVGLTSTLFVKPAHYADEAERRIVIERKKDILTSTMRFTDRSLLKYIDVIE